MAMYKNLKTGLCWDITDEALAARLDKDADYEKVDATPAPTPTPAAPAPGAETKTAYDDKTADELKTLAKTKGLTFKSDVKKAELVAMLTAADAAKA